MTFLREIGENSRVIRIILSTSFLREISNPLVLTLVCYVRTYGRFQCLPQTSGDKIYKEDIPNNFVKMCNLCIRILTLSLVTLATLTIQIFASFQCYSYTNLFISLHSSTSIQLLATTLVSSAVLIHPIPYRYTAYASLRHPPDNISFSLFIIVKVPKSTTKTSTQSLTTTKGRKIF